jgi:hypothetical protein
MNAIKPGSITGDIIPGTDFKQKRKNIERFLQACSSYGVSKDMLFAVDDLLLMQNIPKVTRCLFALGKLVFISNIEILKLNNFEINENVEILL